MIIDYGDRGDGMNKVIDGVEGFVKEKVMFLVGMGGERDLRKRGEMGRVGCGGDYVIFSGDNGGKDDGKMLTGELGKGGRDKNYIEFDEGGEGIREGIDIGEGGDRVVLG